MTNTTNNTNKTTDTKPSTPPMVPAQKNKTSPKNIVLIGVALILAIAFFIGVVTVVFKVLPSIFEKKEDEYVEEFYEENKENFDDVINEMGNNDTGIGYYGDSYGEGYISVDDDYYTDDYYCEPEDNYDAYDYLNEYDDSNNTRPLYVEADGFYSIPLDSNVAPEDNFFIDENTMVVTGEIVIRPRYVYWNGNTLVAECVIVSGCGPVDSIQVDELELYGYCGTVASANFGTIDNLVFEDNYYAYHTFEFAPETVQSPGADIRCLLCFYDGYYVSPFAISDY